MVSKSSLLLVTLMFICIVVEANGDDVSKRNVFRRFRQRPRQMRVSNFTAITVRYGMKLVSITIHQN